MASRSSCCLDRLKKRSTRPFRQSQCGSVVRRGIPNQWSAVFIRGEWQHASLSTRSRCGRPNWRNAPISSRRLVVPRWSVSALSRRQGRTMLEIAAPFASTWLSRYWRFSGKTRTPTMAPVTRLIAIRRMCTLSPSTGPFEPYGRGTRTSRLLSSLASQPFWVAEASTPP